MNIMRLWGDLKASAKTQNRLALALFSKEIKGITMIGGPDSRERVYVRTQPSHPQKRR